MDVFQKVSNSGWISVKKKLPESGQEVLIYFKSGEDCHNREVLTYFKKGAPMQNIFDMDEELKAAERLLSAIFMDNYSRAPEDGFYILADNGSGNMFYRKHADVITHWQPLPNYPTED